MEPDVAPTPASPEAEAPSLETRILAYLEERRPRAWLEILSAVLISLATVGSAWSAYQATRWSGQQSILQSQATAERIEATIEANRAASQVLVDVGMFLQLANAVSRGDTELAKFLRSRARPEFKPALDAWLALKPLENPDAPSSPFAMKEYVVEAQVKAEQLMKEAQATTEQAKQANQINDNYILLTVALASVLFLAGVGPKFGKHGLQIGLTVLGVVVLLVVLGELATFPVH